MSIRLRLAIWYFCSLALILGGFAITAWFAMGSSMLEAVDHDLRLRMEDVQQFIDREVSSAPTELEDDFNEQAGLGLGGGMLEVHNSAGKVLYRSARLGSAQIAEKLAARVSVQYSTARGHGPTLRLAARSIDVRGQQFSVWIAEPLHEFLESRERFEGILLPLAGIALLLAALGGYGLSRRALAPVDHIISDARRITIANLDIRLEPPRSKDEVQRLVLTLNDMLQRIHDAVKSMVQFTADASHELRAPITLIHMAAEFSLLRERSHEELLDAMRKIERAAAKTSRLLENLLLLARADSGSDHTNLHPIDCGASVRDAIEQTLILAKAKNVGLTAEIPPHLFVIEGDEAALSRLWLILLDNAVKYTNAGGEIRFVLGATDGHAKATVADTGVGIAPEDLPHVFDRFWRADKVRSRAGGGVGLGLSIARSIVERHHGTIDVSSQPGKGTEFTVRLPLAARNPAK